METTTVKRTHLPPPSPDRVTPFVIHATAVACLGGVLFGYDLGVISGALPSLTSTLSLTDSQTETVVAFLFLGSIIGSVVGGLLCDKVGRRKAILCCDVIFLLGSVVLSTAPNYAVVLIGRVVVGIALSVSAIADVSYLTEISPEHHRGALVSCNEACISLGFLLAYVASYTVTVSINYDQGWRIMFGLSGLIAVLQFVLMMRLPESPIWLAEHGRPDEARATQFLIRGGGDGARDIPPIDGDGGSRSSDFDPIDGDVSVDGDQLGPLPGSAEEEEEEEGAVPPSEMPPPHAKGGGGQMFEISHYWRQAAIAAFLAVSQQLCGHINILNFAPEIFAQVFWNDDGGGSSSNTATAKEEQEEEAISSQLLATTVILGTVKFVLTTFVIFEVDRIGRRFLLLSGVGIITVSLLFLTLAFSLGSDDEATEFTRSQRALALVGCSGVVAGYSLSYAPLTWLITSELFPASIRGRSLGASTVATNVFAALISYTFLSGQDMFGPAMPFALYFIFSFGSWVFAMIAVPDTGDVVAGGNGEDVDKILDGTFLWRQGCCQGGLWHRRSAVSLVDEETELQLGEIAPPAIT